MIEIVIVLMVGGVLSAMSMGKMHDIMVQQRIARAATALHSDLANAFAIAARDRKPTRIYWDATSMQFSVTNHAGTMAYRHTSLGSDAYGLKTGNVSVSESPIDVYPNGLASDSLTITFTTNNLTKSVHMSRAGLVLIQ